MHFSLETIFAQPLIIDLVSVKQHSACEYSLKRGTFGSNYSVSVGLNVLLVCVHMCVCAVGERVKRGAN